MRSVRNCKGTMQSNSSSAQPQCKVKRPAGCAGDQKVRPQGQQSSLLPYQKQAIPNVRRNPLLSVPDWRGFSPNVWIVWFSQDKLQHSIHFQPAIKKDFPTPHVHAGARIRCQMLILRGPKCSTFKHQAAVHSASIHCPFSVHSDRKSSIQPEIAVEIVTF